MDLSNETNIIRELLAGGQPNASEIGALLINPQRTRTLLASLGVEVLLDAVDICKPDAWPQELYNIFVGLLQQIADNASHRNDVASWRAALEALLRLRPLDMGLKWQLLRPLNIQGDHARIVELMEPHLPILWAHPEDLAQYGALTVVAAYECGRLDIVKQIHDGRAASGIPSAEAEAVLRRMALLESAGFGGLREVREVCGLAEALRTAALALDEYSLLTALSRAATASPNAELDVWSLGLALAIAGVMLAQSWARPFRAALHIAASCLARTGAVEQTRITWVRAALPEIALEPFLILAVSKAKASTEETSLAALRRQPEVIRARQQTGLVEGKDEDEAFTDAIDAFRRAPSVDLASKVWSAAYISGRFADLVRSAPLGAAADTEVDRARALQAAPLLKGTAVPLWLMLSWHRNPDRLLQTAAAYVGEARLILSIGADCRPAGLSRATASLLCAGVQFLARPVVAWGAQRGWYHNFVEMLELFHERAEPDAWFQMVCEGTYPLKSLTRLGNMTHEGQVFRPHYSTKSWRKEWSDEVADDLPTIYANAMTEAFSTGAPREFIKLSTNSPMHGTSDFRLLASTWNYSPRVLRIDWDKRTSWHNYMISPFEADMRWLSFSRLQELVDVSTEARSTYVRRLHPRQMRWVHSVFMKYDLRTGDPWVYLSRRFVDQMLADPGFDELFSAMNLGFAPEMNFVDTYAATHKLFNDISHHYHVVPSEVASDNFLPQVCEGADQFEKSFVRRTDLQQSQGLVDFFAQRILEERSTGNLHWVVAAGQFADDSDDSLPMIDELLLERFFGGRLDVRNLIGSSIVRARFEPGRIVALDDGRILATWSLSDGVLRVNYEESANGTKEYERAGGDANVLTLVPSELVSPHNGWSAFLDFHLSDLRSDLDVGELGSGRATAVLVEPTTWIGAATAPPAILSAFADPHNSNLPTPTVRANGGVFEIRELDGTIGVLCSLDGFPALLEVAGFAEAGQRTAVHLKAASVELASSWSRTRPSALVGSLARNAIFGMWTLEVVEGRSEIILCDDGCVRSREAEILGRWCLRPDGLQLLGLDKIRFGLAEALRLEDRAWTLAGWGWRSFKEAVSFSLHRAAPH